MATPRIKTATALRWADNSPTELGKRFDPPITAAAVCQWGEYLPELRSMLLISRFPGAVSQLVEPADAPPERAG